MRVLWLAFLLWPALVWAQDKAVLTAIKAEVFKEQGRVVLIGQVRGRQPEREMTLKADRLEMLRQKGSDDLTHLDVKGNVVLTQRDATAEFDHGTYEKGIGLATIEGSVILTDPKTRIEGHRAIYDLNRQSAKVLAQPDERVFFRLLKSAQDDPNRLVPVEGRAKEILLFEVSRKAVLQQQVEVHDQEEDAHLTAGRVVIFLDENQELEEMTASGGFTMKQPGRDSKSDRAVLDYKKRLVTLLGNAEVFQLDEGRVEGERIEMHMDPEKGLVSGQRRQPLRIEIPLD